MMPRKLFCFNIRSGNVSLASSLLFFERPACSMFAPITRLVNFLFKA